jgi:hypothetical protein
MRFSLRTAWPLFLFLIAFHASRPAFARKSSLAENQKGVLLGGGLNFFWLPNDNKWDPVPELAPAGTTVTGTDSGFVLPISIGIHYSTPAFGFEFWCRYIASMGNSWSATGVEGAGSSTFASVGGGGQLTIYPYNNGWFRFGVAGIAEYVKQKLELQFVPTSGGTQYLWLTAPSVIFGGGVQPEMWLGNMWALALFFGYEYGMTKTYTALKAGELFGVSYAKGDGSIATQNGGFLLEARLRLGF